MKISRILVPVDFSESSEKALAFAVSLGTQLDAVVDVLHVYEVIAFYRSDLLVIPTKGGNALPVRDALKLEAQEQFDEFLAKCAKRGAIPTSFHLVSGSPAKTIAQYASEHGYDLVVMGTRGRSGPSKILLGSVAQRVVEHALCPVLTIRGA